MSPSGPSGPLVYKGVFVLHSPWVCIITAGMQNDDEGLPSIILAGRGLLMKIEPHGIF